MASRNGQIADRVRDRFEQAQKRLVSFEKDANKVARDLIARGRTAQKDFARELDRLTRRVRGRDLLNDARVKEMRNRAEELSSQVAGRLAELQAAILNVAGVASKEQVSALSRDLKRLAKKVEALAKTGRQGKADGIAA